MQVGLRLPFLVLTRFHDMHCYLDAMHRGAVDYLGKPLTGSELSPVIETHRRLQYAPLARHIRPRKAAPHRSGRVFGWRLYTTLPSSSI
jgi:FixJ family two-component response regulator